MTEFKSKSEIVLSMLPDSFRGRVLEVKYDRNAYNEACDAVINLQLSDIPSIQQLTDRAEFLTEFDEPSLTAEMQMWAANFVLTKTVKKGRDARPSRNPFAEPSVRKHKR